MSRHRHGGDRKPASEAPSTPETPAVDPIAFAVEEARLEPVEAPSETVALDVAPEPVYEPAPQAVVAAKVVIATGAGESEPRFAAFQFAWPASNGFELWKENTSALYDLMEALGAAKTPSEVFALQTKFATGRLNALVKQAQEFAKLPSNLFRAA
jgi:hypothetical protein